MAFKVNARTILQLGEELISSDAVAFYELIKNSFDAKSRRVDIDIVVRLPYDLYVQHRDVIAGNLKDHSSKKRIDDSVFQSVKDAVIAAADATAPNVKSWVAEVRSAHDFRTLAGVVDAANYIEIVDTGTGMSHAILEEVYLTIG